MALRLPEFKREVMRRPLEDGMLTISRCGLQTASRYRACITTSCSAGLKARPRR